MLGEGAGAPGAKVPAGTGPPMDPAWTLSFEEGALPSSIAPMVESGASAKPEGETAAMVLSGTAALARPITAMKTARRTAARRAISGDA